MKVTPKHQKGGNLDAFFTTYVPVQIQAPNQTSSQQRSSGNSQSSEKGKLTEKDFFDMLKDIDGLPNEMNAIVGNLMSTFQMNNLTGIDSGNLAIMYLQNLYQIKVAAQNKATYDKVIEQASKSGSMSEPAISLDGRLVAQNDQGQVEYVDLDTYFSSPNQYHLLSVSNLANLRKYDPSLAYNQTIFNIIDNSIGFEEFQDILDKAKSTLGQTEYQESGLSNKSALAGLSYIQALPSDQRAEVLKAAMGGIYTYDNTNKNNISQVRSLIEYMQAVLPERAKVWAAWKLQTPNKEKAANYLISKYLEGKTSASKTLKVDWKGTTNKLSQPDGSGSSEDPKKGFWSQIQSGQGGDDFRFTLLNKNGVMSVNGKYHGTTPGLDSNKSLGDYINDSRVGYLIKNNKNITFGDAKISINSFNDIMVNSYGGAAIVTLPVKADGTVDLNVAERYIEVMNKLKDSGIPESSQEYAQRMRQLMKDNRLEGLLDSNGMPNQNRFGQFLVLEGYTSEKAKAVQDNKQVSFKDIKSDFIISAGDDKEVYDMIQKGLSNKDRGEYNLNRNWDWSPGSDKLYKGNIYIPLGTNPISGYNADENDIKESTSYLYEKAQQQKSTSSSVVN